MSTIVLREDIGLDLIVINGTTYVTAALVLKHMQIAVASAPRDAVYLLASGYTCLAIGDTHFPLTHAHLKEVAAVLGMPMRGAPA